MPYYAQIDAENVCFAVSQLTDETESPSLIPISSLDATLIGRRWTGSAWADPPAPPFETRRQNAINAVTAHRYAVETGGTMFSGWPVPTGRESQGLINAAYTLARDGYWHGGWKFADGIYRTLSTEQAIGLALTVAAHVEACFAREAEIAAALRAATDDAGLVWEW